MSSDAAKSNESKRKQVRYPVSDDCRLKASIKLRSADPGTAGKDWSGTVVDMSADGAHIQTSLGAVAAIGDGCVVNLAHGGLKAELRGSLAHYVCSSRVSMCGVRFDYSFSGTEKAYLPFFNVIVASSALTAGPAGIESPKRHREEYTTPGHAKLVVWREEAGGGATILGFDYTIARYRAVLATVGADMFKNKEQVRFKAAEGDTDAALSKAHELDARWEFSLAASNLPKIIAPDIRRLLRLVS